MKDLFLFLIFTFASVGFVLAQEKVAFDVSNLKVKDSQAYQVLLKAEVFRLGDVDYIGATSDEEAALRILLKSKKSVESFENLTNDASPEGKLYALLGLRAKNKVAYQQALLRLKSGEEPPERKSFWGVITIDLDKPVSEDDLSNGIVPKGEVALQSGCVISRKTWADILAVIEAGEYDKYFRKG